MNCRCGTPVKEGQTLCDRCRYYQSVFTPPIPLFESRREKARKALRTRKMTKDIVKWTE